MPTLLLAMCMPSLAQAQLYSKTTSGAWSYTIPANTYFVTVTVVGGGGGGGGWDAVGKGGDGGKSASVTGVVGVTPGQVLSGTVAAGGTGGASPNSAAPCTGGGVGGTGGATGGRGGHQSCGSGYSGGGGGGGGSTTLVISANIVLQAGGGGGGGGGGLNNPATVTGVAANATALTGVATCSATAGVQGTNAPGDGGGGGGGGAGSTGGAGGNFGADNTTTPSTAGGGGGSCYLTGGATYVDAVALATGVGGGTGATGYATGGSGSTGSVTITALPSLLLQKTWGANSRTTDSIAVSTTGGTKVATVSSSGVVAGGTTAGTRVYEKAGDAITLPAETFTPGASSTAYTATLTCTNATSPPTNATPPRSITLTAADTAAVCTYTNKPNADLSITKSNGVTTVVSGQPTTYTIVISNGGPAPANNSTVTDTPGSGLSGCVVTCTGTTGGASCPAPLANVLTSGATIATLPGSSTVTLSVTCNVN